MHGHEHAIDSSKGKPEVELAERFVETACEHFWEPEKQRAENCECRGDAHDQMKVAGDEVVADGNGGEIVAGERKSGDAACQKKRNESESKKHRRIELDSRIPKCAEPTEQEYRGRQAERRCQQRKNQRRPRIEAARKHVLAPHEKAQEADAAKSENRGALGPNRFARKSRKQMGDDSETRKHGDIHFGLGEKPEESLPERKQRGLRERRWLLREKSKRREELRGEEAVGQEKNTSGEENAENQHAQNGVDEPGPNGEGHSRQSHALGAKVDRSNGKVERCEQGSQAEERNAGGPKCEAGVWRNEKSCSHASERGDCGPKGKQIQRGKRHFSGADFERQEIIAEPGLRRCGEYQENHQRPVKHGYSGVALRRAAESGEKRHLRGWPHEVNAHQQREKHPEKHAAQGKPQIAKTDHLVTGVENGAG